MNFIDRWLYSKPWYRKLRGLPEPMNPAIAEVTREALSIMAAMSFLKSVNADRENNRRLVGWYDEMKAAHHNRSKP